MKPLFYLAIITGGLFVCCKQSPEQKTVPVAPRDRSITSTNSFSELFMDSAALEKFIGAKKMHDSMANRLRSFYNSRNYQYAWFFNDGLAPYAGTFRQMQNDYISYSGDSVLNNPALQQLIDSFSNKQDRFTADSTVLQTELGLTWQFFRYASRAYQGRRSIDMKDLGWYIPRKRINVVSLLDSMIRSKKDLSQLEPVNRQYNLLKDHLLKYYAIEKQGGWQPIPVPKKNYTAGDSSQIIVAIKKRLQLTGDLSGAGTTPVYDDSLQAAVKNFQRRYGISDNGVINKNLVNEMNRPVEERIRQLLVNMERIRWVPVQPSTDFLLVNIPGFRLHVYEKGNYAWSMNVVVGSEAHNTVIFTSALQYVVFSPYWNVPNSIYKKEVLPAMQRNKNYLARHNMEKVGNGVRQKPGPNNSLGLVKFLFPNSYHIYLHDTPAKSLFNEDARAFSHGCIRLAQAKKLAEWLLRKDSSWNTQSITKAMNAGREKYVTLKEKVPVFIGYFTAWVDREGKLNFRNDIYGHDKKLAAHLFMNGSGQAAR